jgi:hypothetical protein
MMTIMSVIASWVARVVREKQRRGQGRLKNPAAAIGSREAAAAAGAGGLNFLPSHQI